jgi:hypothetical protein
MKTLLQMEMYYVREYTRILAVLNINYARSEILVSCLVYIDQCFFLSKLLIFFMECSNVVTLAEWYDVILQLKKM